MPVFRVATNSTSPGSPESPSRNAKGRERLANRRLRLTVKDKDPRFLGLGSEFVLKTFSKIERILNIVLLVLLFNAKVIISNATLQSISSTTRLSLDLACALLRRMIVSKARGVTGNVLLPAAL